jgi:hypothetical protein
VHLRDGVGSSGGGLPAGSAVPDTDSSTLDGVLSAELTHVAGVLCDLNYIVSTQFYRRDSFGRAHLHLLDLLTERGTVTGTVLSGNADLLCAYIAINSCSFRRIGEAYAWSFWRCCGLLEVDGYGEVDVFAEVAALQIGGVAKHSLIDRGSNLGPEQPATDAR